MFDRIESTHKRTERAWICPAISCFPAFPTAAGCAGVLDVGDQVEACLQLPHSSRDCPNCRCELCRSAPCDQAQAGRMQANSSHQALTWLSSQASQAHVPLPRTPRLSCQHAWPRHSAAAPGGDEVRRASSCAWRSAAAFGCGLAGCSPVSFCIAALTIAWLHWLSADTALPSQPCACAQEAPGHRPAPASVPAAVHRPAWQALRGKRLLGSYYNCKVCSW